MSGWRKHLVWAATALVLAAVLVSVSSWRGFLELIRVEPLLTEQVQLETTVQLDGATINVTSAGLGDSEQFDVSRVDDETQQVLRVSAIYLPAEVREEVQSCTAQVTATVDGVTARYQPQFSLSEVACDGTDLTPQQSQFYFVLPKGEVSDAALHLQVGSDSSRWLAVDLRGQLD